MVKEKVTLLFLMETKVRNKAMQRLRVSLGFDGLLTVDPVGKSGGLVLMWKNANEVKI
jgi:hypothetical protein